MLSPDPRMGWIAGVIDGEFVNVAASSPWGAGRVQHDETIPVVIPERFSAAGGIVAAGVHIEWSQEAGGFFVNYGYTFTDTMDVEWHVDLSDADPDASAWINVYQNWTPLVRTQKIDRMTRSARFTVRSGSPSFMIRNVRAKGAGRLRAWLTAV